MALGLSSVLERAGLGSSLGAGEGRTAGCTGLVNVKTSQRVPPQDSANGSLLLRDGLQDRRSGHGRT